MWSLKLVIIRNCSKAEPVGIRKDLEIMMMLNLHTAAPWVIVLSVRGNGQGKVRH